MSDIEVRIPDQVDKSEATMVDDLTIVFVEIKHFEAAETPNEFGNGVIHSFNRRHSNFLTLDAHHLGSREEAEAECRKKFGNDIVVLGYFEHGNCIWHVSSHKPLGTEGDYRWDGVSFAGIWVPTKNTVKSASAKKLKGAERTAYMEELAEQACEIYIYWCNGEVYEYRVEAYNVRQSADGMLYDACGDYRYDEPIAEDMSCGYYGWDDLLSAVNESVKQVRLDITNAREGVKCKVQRGANMKMLVTRKMAGILAECCCYHEDQIRSLKRYLICDANKESARIIKCDIKRHKKFVDAIQELMARRMIREGGSGE